MKNILPVTLGITGLAALCYFTIGDDRPTPSAAASSTSGKTEVVQTAPVHVATQVGPVLDPTPADEEAAPVDFAAWMHEVPRQPNVQKIAAFRQWTKDWMAAERAQRGAMQEEGLRRARERRPEFQALIVVDPKQALEDAVPRVVRQELPEEILHELEKPVSATGDYNVYLGRPAPGAPIPAQGLSLRYFETAGGTSYKAHVFGEMTPVMTKKGIPLRGVAMDRDFAVAESPVRQLEVGERIPAGKLVEENCPVSGKTTMAVAADESVTEQTPTIEIGERVITLCDGSHVTVMDEKYRTMIQASGPGGAGFFYDAFPGTSSRAIGNFRCLYIRVTYPDQMSAPITEDGAYTDMRNVTRYYLETSYGKMTTTTVVTPLVILPHTQKWYIDKDSEVNGLGLVHSDSRSEAKKIGYDPGQFDCIIVRVNGGPRLSGISWGGGDSVWVTWNGMDVLNHECGHSLGLNHANFWSTTDGTAYGNGSNSEYGNSFDVMGGGGGFGAHYNTISKRQLGWLPSGYVHSPKANGVYRIHAYDQPQLEEGKRYAINVAKDSIRSYNIEYHPAYSNFSNSATVLYSGMGSNAGHLLDTTPGSSGGKNDGGIQIGCTYSDLEADMHFTVLGKNATTPPSLDVAYFRGPFPGNQAPTLSLAASATAIAAGGSVTFTAAGVDPDGDALAYQWDFDDGQTAANSAEVTRTFTSVAQITAMVTVSDMKGATARRHVVINVGAHGKQTVTGNVSWNAAPLAGVRIGGGGKYCYTDSDGNYALSGISTGAQTLTATLNGFAFTPQFANPLTVVAGSNTADWTASSSNFVTLSNIANPVEGGTNGTLRFTRTGDTSAAMVVRISPPGGTAVKTTDYTFTPDFATDGSYRSFTIPAGSATLDVVVAAVNDTAQEGPETITMQLASNGNYLSNSSSAIVMTVQDNDTSLPQVAVSGTDPYATEAPADAGVFTFTRTGSTASALNLSVTWSGTAISGSDYASLATTVTIPSGQSSTTVNVAPLNDGAIEVPEDCTVTINTNAAYVRDSSAQTASVTIADDDTPVITVGVPDASAAEAGLDSGVFLITRTGSTVAPLKVYFGLSGSALHGTDYAPLIGEVTIPAGAVSAPVVISPYDDDLGETETESVTLAVTTFNSGYSLGADFQGTLEIADNDDVPVVSVRAGAVGTEGGSNASVVFRAVGSASGNITVNYAVTGTATAGSDYTALSGTVTIPASGANDATVTIPITNDAIPEAAETVVVTITPSSSYRVYNDGSAQAVIRDNDSGERVMVSTYNDSPTEAGATGRFYFSRTGTTGDLAISYSVSGTATNGVDYAVLSGTATILDTQPGVIVTMAPIEDVLGEGTETVTVTVLAGTGYGIDLPASATFSIPDNDASAITVGFQQTAVAMSEQPGPLGEYRDVSVVLSASSASPVTLTCVAGGGSAMGDDTDWGFVDAANGNVVIPYATLTFAPGVTSQNVRIRVKNDGVAEGLETAWLELRSPVNAGFTTGRSKQSIALFDDLIASLAKEERWNTGSIYTNNTWDSVNADTTALLGSFTPGQNVADNYSRRIVGQIIAPTTGSYTFWIASDDASRLYLSTDATAANKVQIAGLTTYTSFQNWDANASQRSAAINLVGGQSYYMEVQHQEGGGGDHVSVAWEGPGFTRIPVALTPALDTAPRTVRFLTNATTRLESDGNEPLLMVTLDRPAAATPVTVQYTVGGTATAGSDFLLSPGSLTFAAGEQVKLLPLTILSDAVGETPEAIVVALANSNGAQIASPSSHTITIQDADAPIVATQQFTATSAMSSATVIGTMSANVASGRTVSAWSVLAGNEGNVFAISASGQVSLVTPGALPSPGTRQLVVRATDSAGATGDGTVNVVCNPPTQSGVLEQRWSGTTAYDTQNWGGTPNYSGTLTTFTTPQNVADSYSRRLTGYLQPQVSGDYTFWVASDDDSRLFLSTDETAADKVQIAAVVGWTNYQAWDSQASQKSAVISLQAGKVYWMEVHQKEGGGGDHASVAWSGPGISRQAIPASAIFPNFGASPMVPSVAITSPAAGTEYSVGSNIDITATVAGGSLTTTAVEFYSDGNLIGSDTIAPYVLSWSNAAVGAHTLTAKAVNSGGAVSSMGVGIIVNGAALPDGWTGEDIGSVGLVGSASESGGTYTVSGSGADIWNTSDAFQFASQSLVGNGEIRARVTSQTNTSAWAKAGVMIRDGTAPGAAHAMMVITPGNGFALQYRATTNGTSSHIAGPALNAAPNNWVRLTRSGTTLTGYVSADGTTWTQVGSLTISMASTVNAGLAVTSTNNSALSTAIFDQVSVTPYPSPWLTSDIGTPGLAGRAEYFNNVHTVTGAGTLGGTTDNYRYVYQTLSGDGSIVARVSALQNTGTSARLGVMIRDTLTSNSRMAALSVNGSGAWRWQRRTSTGGSVSATNSSSGTAPNLWVRLVRSGNTITASRSTNGTSWTTIGSVSITMATNCYIGLNVASGSTTATNTSSFDNVTVVP